MAVSVAECDAMIAASSAVGCVADGRPLLAVPRRRDRACGPRRGGELGEVVKTRGYGVHANWGPERMVHRPARSPAAARSLDMGVHAIDTARFLLGDPNPAASAPRSAPGTATYEVDDDAILLISWSQGTNSIVESGLVAPARGRHGGRHRGLRYPWVRADLPPEEPSEDYEHCTQPMYTAQMASSCGDRRGPSAAADRRGRPGRDAGRRRRRTRRPARPDVEPETGIEPVTSSLPWRSRAVPRPAAEHHLRRSCHSL